MILEALGPFQFHRGALEIQYPKRFCKIQQRIPPVLGLFFLVVFFKLVLQYHCLLLGCLVFLCPFGLVLVIHMSLGVSPFLQHFQFVGIQFYRVTMVTSDLDSLL